MSRQFSEVVRGSGEALQWGGDALGDFYQNIAGKLKEVVRGSGETKKSFGAGVHSSERAALRGTDHASEEFANNCDGRMSVTC